MCTVVQAPFHVTIPDSKEVLLIHVAYWHKLRSIALYDNPARHFGSNCVGAGRYNVTQPSATAVSVRHDFCLATTTKKLPDRLIVTPSIYFFYTGNVEMEVLDYCGVMFCTNQSDLAGVDNRHARRY